MEKKYKLKTENHLYNEDGANNPEHIIDIIQEIDILYSNIKDNKDICLHIFESNKNNHDDDTLRAMGLICENIDEVEQKACDLFVIIEKAKENLKNINKENERDFSLILGEMQMLEEKSSRLMKSMF